MFRKAAIPLAVVVLVAMFSPSALSQEKGSSVVPHAYIVKVKQGVDVDGVARAVGRATGGAIGHVYRSAFQGFSIRVPPGVGAARILSDKRVIRVEPDLRVAIPPYIQKGPPPGKGPGNGGKDEPPPSQATPTGVDRIGADSSAIANIDGVDERVDVDIAILDTGIDLDHPDLNVVAGINFTGKGKDADDKNGHGTHVAGTAAAVDNGIGVVGVAPGARLHALKVLDNSGSGYLTDVIAGIDWVTANAGTIEVANMSLSGTGTNKSFREAIQASVAAGVVYVVAAGNSGREIYGLDGNFNSKDDVIPAAYPEVATISALADSDGSAGGAGGSTSTRDADDTFAYFSNYNATFDPEEVIVSSSGGAIDLAAPGVDILSTWKGGGYNTISGTSMASPHVAGAVALYIARFGRASSAAGVEAIRQALIDLGELQSAWGPINTEDPDNNEENLVDVGTM